MMWFRSAILLFFAIQSLDASKPNWTLRVVSDQNDADAIEVKKDTERVDEIRALKQAWETAEPGRAIKVTYHFYCNNFSLCQIK